MAKETEKDDVYFVVYHWMIARLGLKGAALLVYALIYGYTKNVGEFAGSLAYISTRTAVGKTQVQEALKKLVESGLLKKQDVYANGIKFVRYIATDTTDGGIPETGMVYRKPDGGIPETGMGYTGNRYGGIPETGTNNTKNNKKENTLYNKDSAVPDVQEIFDYCWQKQNYVDAEKFWQYYTDRGWKRKNGRPIDDWRTLVDEWDEREKKMAAATKSTSAAAGKTKNTGFSGESSFDTDEFFDAALRRSYNDGG